LAEYSLITTLAYMSICPWNKCMLGFT